MFASHFGFQLFYTNRLQRIGAGAVLSSWDEDSLSRGFDYGWKPRQECGSQSYFGHYFANISELDFNVSAIDVTDNRLVRDGYSFQLTSGVGLPFANETFDVLVTNHVIEHVGDYGVQCEHLKEIRRVLKKSGTGYLAVPNRWMLVEPHFKLIFLSWLPRGIRTPYLKFMKKGDFYDCEPLEKYELEKMLLNANLIYKNKCIEALKLTLQLEMQNSKVAQFFGALPNFLYRPFIWLIPTLIYTFHRAE